MGKGYEASNDYAAGTAAGVSTVLIGHPFDTIKVKLQTQIRSAHAAQRWNALQFSAHLFRTEGVKGFYRGATPSFIGVSLESAFLFGSYTQLKTYLQAGDVNSPLLSSVVPAAALSGAGISVILCPSELVKCRLQVHPKGSAAGAQKYNGPLDCIRKTVKTEGVQGLFRGLITTSLRESVGNTCFFLTYEIVRHRMLTRPTRSSSIADKADLQDQPEGHYQRSNLTNFLKEAGAGIISGGLAGMAFWTVVLPLDVAKTHIQTAQNLRASRNPLVYLKMIYKESGVRGLYAGLAPTLTRAFPANAAAICAWELTAQLLARYQ